MSIDMSQNMEVVSPKPRTFLRGVIPQDRAVQLHLAVGPP
jgi:hypothetical protein